MVSEAGCAFSLYAVRAGMESAELNCHSGRKQ